MEFHEIANLFPMMGVDEFEQLKGDIKANGLLEPIWLYEGKILDGRNRWLACGEVGEKPHFNYYQDDQPVSFVISKNVIRRHLTASQKAIIAVEAKKMLEVDARKRQVTSSPGVYGGKPLQEIFPEAVEGQSRDQAGQMFGVSGRYISEAEKIKQEAPEYVEPIKNGEMTFYEAIKIIKKKQRARDIQEQVKEIEQNNYTPPSQEFDVIVIDPPWPYGTQYDPNGRRAANPYPEMSLDEIKAIKLPASKDCILWLWTTHKFMRESFEILDNWGFRDVAILTWVKSHMGLGSWLRSQTEFCIMAVRGKPKVNLTNQTTVIHGDLREHSRKPDEFYQMVDQLCIGYKIDWFSRQPRDGWAQVGNDTEKFA